MYDLSTINRLNDAAALREQFPGHDCAEEVLYNPEYESFGDSYIDYDVYQSVKDDRDALGAEVRRFSDHLRAEGEEWAARDLEAILAARGQEA
jgi:hypothetical protein